MFCLHEIHITRDNDLTRSASNFVLRSSSPEVLIGLGNSVITKVSGLIVHLNGFPTSVPTQFLYRRSKDNEFKFRQNH